MSDVSKFEVKTYLNSDNAELDEDDLDAVAGGKGASTGDVQCNSGSAMYTLYCKWQL